MILGVDTGGTFTDFVLFDGKGVRQAVEAVNGEIFETIGGLDAEDQLKIDHAMIDLDGTPEVITGNRAWNVEEVGGSWSMSLLWESARLVCAAVAGSSPVWLLGQHATPRVFLGDDFYGDHGRVEVEEAGTDDRGN